MKMKSKFFKEIASYSLKSNKVKIIKESNSFVVSSRVIPYIL